MNRLQLILIRIAIVLLSTGWVLPLWFCAWLYLDFSEAYLWPLAQGRPVDLGSFPHLAVAKQCLAIAMIWLALALAYWSYRLADRRRSGRGGTG